MTSVPFTLLTAFSSSINGGNPAAVVFMDLTVPTSSFEGIARNLNQPMTSFLSEKPLPSKNEKVAKFGIRWYTPSGHDAPLCGHASLAAARAVFDRPDLVSGTMETIELHTLTHGIVTARKVEGGFIEIQLPAGEVEEVFAEEKVKFSEMVAKAFGRTVSINYVGKGTKGFEHCLLVELDEKENIGMCDVDAAALRDGGFLVNIITTASSTGNELFVSRMFAPRILPGDEDHVCGSAHCLMVPYWYKKQGIPTGQEARAKQVSRRGGDLKVVWEAERNIVRLMGATTVLGKGELYLS